MKNQQPGRDFWEFPSRCFLKWITFSILVDCLEGICFSVSRWEMYFLNTVNTWECKEPVSQELSFWVILKVVLKSRYSASAHWKINHKRTSNGIRSFFFQKYLKWPYLDEVEDDVWVDSEVLSPSVLGFWILWRGKASRTGYTISLGMSFSVEGMIAEREKKSEVM